jgi:acyl-CoA thioesterase
MKASSSGFLTAEAREVSKNFKLGTYIVEIRDDVGDIVAMFTGMVYRKKENLPF